MVMTIGPMKRWRFAIFLTQAPGFNFAWGYSPNSKIESRRWSKRCTFIVCLGIGHTPPVFAYLQANRSDLFTHL